MIIAIETATEVCSTALVHASKVLAQRSVREKNIHSERLLMLIDEVLKEANAAPKQLTAVAVSIGPGSFTGLRIGLSAAKGLALALDIPLIAVPTLDGIAESFRSSHTDFVGKVFCAMIEAKREEAFYALYRIENTGAVRLTEHSIKLQSEIRSEAAHLHAETGQPDISAAAVGLIAERNQKELLVPDFSLLEPMYLRDFVATLPKNKG